MKPKREKRREKREAEFGPERKVVTFTADKATLECGHEIHNPPVQATVNMRQPKAYRCLMCLRMTLPSEG